MHNKIDDYLSEIEYVGSYEDHEYGAEELLNRMIDFFTILDPDDLYDEQLDMYMNVMGTFDSYADMDDEDDDFEEMSEAPALLRQKRDKEARRKRRYEYRKNKQQIKAKAKRFRKTAAYKKYTKKKKRFASRGKTTTGKRIRKFY